MKVDNAILVGVIDKCFDLSMDGRVAQSDRLQFLALGKRLRGSLLNLLSAQFDAGTPQVVTANQQIQQVNQRLSTATAQLASVAQVVADVASLVSVLDGLLGIASKFV